MRLTPKNWDEFQHYKDREPSWIKLHKRLLDDYEFQCLQVASRALAPMLWLLASEYDKGVIDADEKKLAFRLRMSVDDLREALKPLIDAGFFSVEQDASEPLAEGYPNSIPEKEIQVEKQEQKNLSLNAKAAPPPKAAPLNDGFDEFWLQCPRKVGKDAARKAYAKALKSTSPATLVEGMRRYAMSRAGQDEQYTAYPASWLNDGRWTDETANANGGVGPSVLDPIVQRLAEVEKAHSDKTGLH